MIELIRIALATLVVTLVLIHAPLVVVIGGIALLWRFVYGRR
jgi:hypothetical protein